MADLVTRTNNFLEKCKQIHGDVYNYSKVIYQNSGSKVTVICKTHGDFLVTPDNHIFRKSGCKKCADLNSSIRQKSSTDGFISKAIEIHGNTYDYSKVNYDGNKTNITITCKLHQCDFVQSPSNHLKGAGCQMCALESRANKRRKPLSIYVEQASLIHQNLYDYSKITDEEYKKSKITIICKTHGEFRQSKRDHLFSKSGCPKCNNSKGENEVRKFLLLHKINFSEQKTFKDLYYKSIKSKLKYDFHLPDFNTLIEFDGIFHYEPRYSTNDLLFKEGIIRDGMKDAYARNNGYTLIRIPYFNFNQIEKIIKNIAMLE